MPKRRQRHPKPPTHLIERDAKTNAVFAIDGEYHYTLHPTRGWRRKRISYESEQRVSLDAPILNWVRQQAARFGF